MRLIDADELLARLETTDRYFMVKYDIERSPTVDQWHYPSKGEYPTEDGFYFVTCDPLFEGGHRFVCMCSYASTENRWIDSRGYTEHCVVAWMPLPDPPKEEA